MIMSESEREEINKDRLDSFLVKEGFVDKEKEEAEFASGFSIARGESNVEVDEEIKNKLEEEKEREHEVTKKDNIEEKEQEKKERVEKSLPSIDYQKEIRDLHGRIGGLNSELIKMRRERDAYEKKVRESAKAPTKEQVALALQDEEKLKDLAVQFPSYAEALEANSRMIENKIRDSGYVSKEELDRVLNEVKQREDKILQDIREKEEKRINTYIDRRHKSWQDTVKSQEFRSWINSQDGSIQNLADSEDPDDAILLLDKFKEFSGKIESNQGNNNPQAKNTDRLEKLVSPKGKESAQAKKFGSEEDDFESGFKSVRGR